MNKRLIVGASGGWAAGRTDGGTRDDGLAGIILRELLLACGSRATVCPERLETVRCGTE